LYPLRNFQEGVFFFGSVNASDSYSFFNQDKPGDEPGLLPIFDSLGFNERYFVRQATVESGWIFKQQTVAGWNTDLRGKLVYQHFYLSQNSFLRWFNFFSAGLEAKIFKNSSGLDMNARYWLTDVRAGNYFIFLQPWTFLLNSRFKISAQIASSKQLADYRYYFFRGNQFYWDYPLVPNQNNFAGLGIELPGWISLNAGMGQISGLPRLNLDLDSIQFSGMLPYFSSRLKIQNRVKSYFFSLDALWQSVSENGFSTGISGLGLRFTNHYAFFLLKGKLRLSPGFDLSVFDRYRPYTFHAPTGLFGYQSDQMIRSGFIGALFLGFKLESFSATLRIDNIFDQAFSASPVMMIDGYPFQSRVLRLNINWLFWD
jgi:hypothetical protein